MLADWLLRVLAENRELRRKLEDMKVALTAATAREKQLVEAQAETVGLGLWGRRVRGFLAVICTCLVVCQAQEDGFRRNIQELEWCLQEREREISAVVKQVGVLGGPEQKRCTSWSCCWFVTSVPIHVGSAVAC